MPYPVNTIYVVISGTILPSEIWAIGVHFDADTFVPTQANLQTYVTALVTPTNTWVNSLAMASLRSSACAANKITAYYYTAGSTVASITATDNLTVSFGATAPTMPNQCSMVVSLRTLDPSRKGRGRFYFPCMGTALTNVGELTSSVVTAAATATKTWVNAVNSVGFPFMIGGTSANPINKIVIDSVVDTQRRRRNKKLASTVIVSTVP